MGLQDRIDPPGAIEIKPVWLMMENRSRLLVPCGYLQGRTSRLLGAHHHIT
jgi:hypothetical protein